MLVNQRTVLSNFVEEHANRSPYSYAELALLCGFNTSDVIYAFMRGELKVPLDKVATLAEALDCDSAQLFALTLKSWFDDELFEQIEQSFGSMQESKAERSWIAALRDIYKGNVPELTVTMRRRLQVLSRVPAIT